ncbi:MAG: hypothetical protein RIT81_13995 [Deltaproteobacteria bacterium]
MGTRSLRRRVVVFAFVLGVALQCVPPTVYYLGDGDPDDERFAWRMFSSTWLRRKVCRVDYDDLFDGRPRIDREAELRFDAAWLPVLQRRWDWATRRVVQHRCEARPRLRRVRVHEVCGPRRVTVEYPCPGAA